MSVQFDPARNRWVVRWYEDGRQRSRRFPDEAGARRFDAECASAKALAREATTADLARELMLLRTRVQEVERQLPADGRMTGVYPYATRRGMRWRIAARRQDGTTTTRRGYTTREAAWRAHEQLCGAHASAAELSFGGFWLRWLADKRPYLTDGAIEDLQAHGTKRRSAARRHRARRRGQRRGQHPPPWRQLRLAARPRRRSRRLRGADRPLHPRNRTLGRDIREPARLRMDGRLFVRSTRRRTDPAATDRFRRASRPERALFEGEFGRIRTVVEGPDGAIYALTSNTTRSALREGDDRILRIIPPAAK